MAGFSGPRKSLSAPIDPELVDRARKFVARKGLGKAVLRLRSSNDTLEQLCSFEGRLRPLVVDRLRRALDREEQLDRRAS